jgi:hypothetical protein
MQKEFDQKLVEEENNMKDKLTHQIESEFIEKLNEQKKTLQLELDQKLSSA